MLAVTKACPREFSLAHTTQCQFRKARAMALFTQLFLEQRNTINLVVMQILQCGCERNFNENSRVLEFLTTTVSVCLFDRQL